MLLVILTATYATEHLGIEYNDFDDYTIEEQCAKTFPVRPIWNGETCVSCQEVFPEEPYWYRGYCLQRRPHAELYITGVIMVLVSLITVSVLRLVVFWTNEDNDIEECIEVKLAATVLSGLCLCGAAGLTCVIAFCKLYASTFWKVLGGVAACFVAAMAIIAFVTGFEDDSGQECDSDADKNPPEYIEDLIADGQRSSSSFHKGFTGAVVATFFIKTIAMCVSLVFAAADFVQLLGWIGVELPQSGVNDILDMLGSDIGDYKWIPICLSFFCNMLFNTDFISELLDEKKTAWEIVGLQFLYFLLESIDNYAALCLGNVSQALLDANPFFAFVLALILGQLYTSDLWLTTRNVVVFCFSGVYMTCGLSCQSLQYCFSGDPLIMVCGGIMLALVLALGSLEIIGVAILFVSQIIPSIIDLFALPCPFFFLMLGVNINQEKYEKEERNNDEKVKGCITDPCENFWDIHEIWQSKNIPKIVHRFLQLIFTTGIVLLLFAKGEHTTNKAINILQLYIIIIAIGGIVVIIMELLGFQKIVVRGHSEIPQLKRNVNLNYLQNRPNNRYGLIPYIGPILSGLSAFMNQPPLMRNGKLLNWDAYAANIITYGAFAGSILCYERASNAWAIVLAATTFLFSAYDIIQDTRDTMNFSFGVCFFDNCRRPKNNQSRSQSYNTKKGSKGIQNNGAVIQTASDTA